MSNLYFKHAEVSPKEVLAGDSVEIAIKLVAGKDFSAKGSRIILDLPAYLGYSRPSCFDQEDGGYVSVFCSNPDLIYRKRNWDMEILDFPTREKTSFKGMAQRLFVLDLLEGEADEDDEIIIKWGYTRHGMGIGTKVSALVLTREFYNSIHVRYFKDGTQGLPDLGRSYKGYDRPVPDEELVLSYRVRPREPESIRVIRRTNKTSILILDRFSNVCDVDSLVDFINEDVNTVKNDYGVFEVDNTDIHITSKDLPLYDAPSMKSVFEGMNIYFGDLHTHSSFSCDCIEREKMEISPDLMYAYGKKVACLDFLAVTDHHQSWDIERNKIGEDKWERTCSAAEEYNREGEFAAFPGLEFRCIRGDTAVIFNEAVGYDKIDVPEMKDIRELWKQLNDINYITIPHFHNLGGLKAGEWYECTYEGVETVLEIYSCHGSYESNNVLERHIPEIKRFRQDRNGKHFLKEGYHYGFVCNSDGHKGNPGSNGLTAVYAPELTRDAIIEAIRKRHVYGTTNARIRLLFTMNGSLMGSVLPNIENKSIFISASGERPFKAVDLMKNGELFKRYKPYTDEFKLELDIADMEASNWYVRVTQLDNHIAYSSPIWFE